MVEHLIAPGGGRDAIDAALEQLLRWVSTWGAQALGQAPGHRYAARHLRKPTCCRPFCKQAAQRGASAACSGGLVATASGADGAAAEPAPAVEASTVLASAEAMDVEQNSSPADTLVELVAAEPVSQAPTDEAWLASVPAAHAAGASVPSTASPQAAQDSDAPFDMWSAQVGGGPCWAALPTPPCQLIRQLAAAPGAHVALPCRMRSVPTLLQHLATRHLC